MPFIHVFVTSVSYTAYNEGSPGTLMCSQHNPSLAYLTLNTGPTHPVNLSHEVRGDLLSRLVWVAQAASNRSINMWGFNHQMPKGQGHQVKGQRHYFQAQQC